ncbi:hypothetical protein L1987_50409 [Smallanthus sonchifolius]|uniref:Uncharacterized protein n=1 Tax=Smallanthus sonchifolius TaxID=185202 RepID=A0ACB9EMS8_9ASTR|nr:hypothetical protein L1987_50409 [Smallanthus sonchifolius]
MSPSLETDEQEKAVDMEKRKQPIEKQKNGAAIETMRYKKQNHGDSQDDFGTPTKSKKSADDGKKDKKRKVADSEDGFETPNKKSEVTQPSKNTRKPFVDFSNKRLSLRVDIGNLHKAIQALSEAQIAAIKEMGFESVLSWNIKSLPTVLAYWLLNNYDEDRAELNMGENRLKITPSIVHEVLGIPMGPIKVLDKNKPRKGVDKTIDAFKVQFDSTRVGAIELKNKMANTQEAGRLFKINFLVLFNTIMGEITKSTTVNQKFIKFIDDASEIPNMDWCSYMIDCLNRTKKTWKEHDYYNGPITLLVVLYTHEFQKRHGAFSAPQVQTPAISYITTQTLYDMELYLNKMLFQDGSSKAMKKIEASGAKKDGSSKAVKNVEAKDAKKALMNVEVGGANEDDVALNDVEAAGANEVEDDVALLDVDDDGENAVENEAEQRTMPQSLSIHTDDFIYHSPLNLKTPIGTYTPVSCTSMLSAYRRPDNSLTREEKNWLRIMDENLQAFDNMVANINELVTIANFESQHNEQIVEKCKLWQQRFGQTTKSYDVGRSDAAVEATEHGDVAHGDETVKQSGENEEDAIIPVNLNDTSEPLSDTFKAGQESADMEVEIEEASEDVRNTLNVEGANATTSRENVDAEGANTGKILPESFKSTKCNDQKPSFEKRSSFWETIGSMEAFRAIPQNPHFRPLDDLKESVRERHAIYKMVDILGVFEKISCLRFDHPRIEIDDQLETLLELETHGFDVGPIRNRLMEMLSFKDKEEGHDTRSKKSKDNIGSQRFEIQERNKAIELIDKQVDGLFDKRQRLVKGNEESELNIVVWEEEVNESEEAKRECRRKFDELATAPF